MFTVGTLYSVQEFLVFIQNERIRFNDFVSSSKPYGLVAASDVINLAIKCGWTRLDNDGVCELTERGLLVVQGATTSLQLRQQILDYVNVEQPMWSARSRWGRSESFKIFPEPVRQLFVEAGLLEEWTDELIAWWDNFALWARGLKSAQLLEIGRRAERKSVEYEYKRTGLRPIWKSLETDYAGYDIESVDSGSRRYIEVKGTEIRFKQASFKVTRHECEVASDLSGYWFHLWILSDPARLFAFPAVKILNHLPSDNGTGKWNLVSIPISTFRTYEQAVT